MEKYKRIRLILIDIYNFEFRYMEEGGKLGTEKTKKTGKTCRKSKT